MFFIIIKFKISLNSCEILGSFLKLSIEALIVDKFSKFMFKFSSEQYSFKNFYYFSLIKGCLLNTAAYLVNGQEEIFSPTNLLAKSIYS